MYETTVQLSVCHKNVSLTHKMMTNSGLFLSLMSSVCCSSSTWVDKVVYRCSTQLITEPEHHDHVITWSAVVEQETHERGDYWLQTLVPGCVTSPLGVNSIRLPRLSSLRYTLYTAASPSRPPRETVNNQPRVSQCHLIISPRDVNNIGWNWVC